MFSKQRKVLSKYAHVFTFHTSFYLHSSPWQRHFSVFAVHFPGAEALSTIYSSILSGHFQQGGYSYGVSRMVGTLVQAAICLHQKMSQNFLPTAIRFHYIFNLRDISNIFQVCVYGTDACVCAVTEYYGLLCGHFIHISVDMLSVFLYFVCVCREFSLLRQSMCGTL